MAESATAEAPIKKIAPKPAKVLPTDRIAFLKQLELLRAYAAAYGSTQKPVTNEEIAKITNLHTSTASLGNTFFASVGLLKKVDPGYVPSAEVLNFARAYEWDKQTAAHKLAPLIVGSWFATAVIPTLRVRPMEEKEAIAAIADVAAVGPGHAGHVRTLLQYLETTGIVGRQGKQLVVGAVASPSAPRSEGNGSDGDGGAGGGTTPVREPKPRLGGAPGPAPVEGGAISYDVSIRVRMDDMSGWSPERISRFFTGLAQVIAAGKEQEESSE